MGTQTFSQLFETPEKDHCLGRMLALTDQLLIEGNRHKHIAEAAFYFGSFRYDNITLDFFDRHKAVLKAASLTFGKVKPTMPNGEVWQTELPRVRPGYDNCTSRLRTLVKQLHAEGYSRSQLTDAIVELAILHASLADEECHRSFRYHTEFWDMEVTSPLPNYNGKVCLVPGLRN